MKLFNLQITDELHADLNRAARASDRSASAFTREAIREKIARQNIQEVPAKAASTATVGRSQRIKKAA